MSLSFLSKKSWHTAKHQNVEAVWVAEEKKKAEDQKVAELQKQLKEEREREELAKITGEDRGDTALNWMYSGGVRGSAADKEREEKEAQEFLLGKEYVSKSNDGNNVIAGSLADAVTVKSLNGTNEKNEYFAKRHEDPMFLIMQERQKEREKIEKYPAQMQRLSEQLSSPVTKKNKKEKKRKKHKKEKHKHKKHKKKTKKRKRSYSSSSDSDSDSDSESDSGEEERRRKKRRKEITDNSPAEPTVTMPSTAVTEQNKSLGVNGALKRDDRCPLCTRLMSRCNCSSRDGGEGGGGVEGGNKGKHSYGLNSRGGGDSKADHSANGPKTHLGPDLRLMEERGRKKEEEIQRKKDLGRRRSGGIGGAPSAPQTREEKLAVMQADAVSRKETRKAAAGEKVDVLKEEGAKGQKAEFLTSMVRKYQGME